MQDHRRDASTFRPIKSFAAARLVSEHHPLDREKTPISPFSLYKTVEESVDIFGAAISARAHHGSGGDGGRRRMYSEYRYSYQAPSLGSEVVAV